MNEHDDHTANHEQAQKHGTGDDGDHQHTNDESKQQALQDGQNDPLEIVESNASEDAQDQVLLETPCESSQANSDDAAGEEMIAILEDVEAQFQKLRHVQQSNDAMISSLSERAEALTAAESELTAERESLMSKLDQFEKERTDLETEHRNNTEKYQRDRLSLNEDREAFEKHRASTTSELEASQTTLEAAQTELESQATKINKQQQELTSRNDELDAQSQALEQRSSELEVQARELSDSASRIAEADRTIESLNQTLEATKAEHKKETSAFASQRDDLEKKLRAGKEKRSNLREQLGLSEKNLKDLQQQLSDRTSRIDELDKSVESLRASLKDNEEKAAASEHEALEMISALESERDTVTNDLNELNAAHANKTEQAQNLKSRCSELAEQIEQLNVSLAEREARLEDHQSKLRVAGEKLTHFAESLRDQGPMLERGAAAIAMVDEQKQQIQDLTTEVAQLKVQGCPEELAKKDERIKSLTEALRQARGQAAGQQDVGELEQSNATLCKELEATKISLHEAQLAMEQAEKKLAERPEERGSPQANDARVSELEATHAALSAQLDEATLREQTATTRFKDRIQELEDELDHARTAASCADGSESGMVKELRDKAERINGVATHLRRRRTRLHRVRQLIEHRARSSATVGAVDMDQHSRQLRSIEDERQQLTELRTVLEASERKMIRKWAHSRAIAVCLWFIVIGTVMAGVAWAAANHFHPAVRSATVTLQAKGTTHTKLDADQQATWATWHKDLIKNEAFTRTLSRRMSDRRFEHYRTPQAVADRLARDLTVDASVPGQLALTLVGTDASETEAFLNLLTATVISESARSTGKHSDGAKAIAPHQTSDGTGIRYASLNATPVSDDRLVKALPIFGGAFAGALLLIALIYAWLSRAKRVFDEGDPVSDFEEVAIQTP